MTSIDDKTSLLFVISNEGANDDSWQRTDNDDKKDKKDKSKQWKKNRKIEQGLGRIIIRGRVQKDYQNLIFTDLTNLIAKIDIFSLIVPRLSVKRLTVRAYVATSSSFFRNIGLVSLLTTISPDKITLKNRKLSEGISSPWLISIFVVFPKPPLFSVNVLRTLVISCSVWKRPHSVDDFHRKDQNKEDSQRSNRYKLKL